MQISFDVRINKRMVPLRSIKRAKIAKNLENWTGSGRALMSFLVNAAFSPDDVDTLRGALNSWCRERRVDIESSEARTAASAAINLFHAGHNTNEKLMRALRQLKGVGR